MAASQAAPLTLPPSSSFSIHQHTAALLHDTAVDLYRLVYMCIRTERVSCVSLMWRLRVILG